MLAAPVGSARLHLMLVALWPHLLVLGLALLSMLVFALRRARHGYQPSADINPTRNVLIPGFGASWFFWCLEGCVQALISLRLAPNQVTILSTVAGLAAGGCYAAGWFGAAGWLLLVSGGLDMMDGWVARRTGRTSKAGDFLDAVCDRYVEISVYLGLGFYYRDRWWMMMACALAVTGSMMVSYTRARGEVMGLDYNKGIFQRAERTVWLSVVSVFSPLAQLFIDPVAPRPFYAPVAVLVVLSALLANLGGLHRTIAIARIFSRQEAGRDEATGEEADRPPEGH
jgi:CDP-diacylglycerol--glycerol-3-phosphate 3-phosphatidyltransferase